MDILLTIIFSWIISLDLKNNTVLYSMAVLRLDDHIATEIDRGNFTVGNLSK